MLNFFGKKKDDVPRLDRRGSLAGIPALNGNVSIDRSDEDQWVITTTMSRRDGWLRRFMPPTLKHRHELDELGTFVLSQVDGRRTVLEIVNVFVRRHKTNRREAELSVVAFFKSLIKRQVVSIVIK